MSSRDHNPPDSGRVDMPGDLDRRLGLYQKYRAFRHHKSTKPDFPDTVTAVTEPFFLLKYTGEGREAERAALSLYALLKRVFYPVLTQDIFKALGEPTDGMLNQCDHCRGQIRYVTVTQWAGSDQIETLDAWWEHMDARSTCEGSAGKSYGVRPLHPLPNDAPEIQNVLRGVPEANLERADAKDVEDDERDSFFGLVGSNDTDHDDRGNPL